MSKQPKPVVVQARLDVDLANRLAAEAKKQQRSVARQVAFILAEWLKGVSK